MQREAEAVRFLAACQELWFGRFPGLHRRAQWHIASHLCVAARDGAVFGELSGLIKQVFLLDDATVRERVSELQTLGLCVLDPADGPISARSAVTASERLLAEFEAYLHALAARLAMTAAALGTRPGPPPGALDQAARRTIIRAVELARDGWIAAAEQVFEQAGLSRGRRIEARRRLLSTSHAALMLMAFEYRYGVAPHAEAENGLLADDMAAGLLALARQNFQTTRDHLADLVRVGLLERRPGRALRVALAEPATPLFDEAFARIAAALPPLAAELAGQGSEADRTATLRVAVVPRQPAHRLLVSGPGDTPADVRLGTEPLLVGRAPGSGLHLPAIEVSRTHCRFLLEDGRLSVRDLDSTNGTLVDGSRISGEAALRPGAVVQIGPYRLTYRLDEDPAAAVSASGK